MFLEYIYWHEDNLQHSLSGNITSDSQNNKEISFRVAVRFKVQNWTNTCVSVLFSVHNFFLTQLHESKQ